ncbi:MAG: hypothetical protein EOO05_10275 [Chitinophagaceae bacterium]|nr:MAG: hypothetical protein EOO05_10275 [Chitinophagaceae bacterium]
MLAWSDHVNTSLLGTERKPVDPMQLPLILQEAGKQLLIDETEREENFLRVSALLLNYRRCGTIPESKPALALAPCPPEEKKFSSTNAASLLKDLFDAESPALVELWLNNCSAHNQVVSPEFIPLLLEYGTQHREFQQAITKCCGERGKWLAGFNPAWVYSSSDDPSVVWENGTTAQRKIVLATIRKEDPAVAIQWLQKTWAAEDAGIKQELLAVLAEHPTSVDIPFLEELATEKSKKVKDAAMGLLKQIAGSAAVLKFEKVLLELVNYKKEKGILGLSTKRSLEFKIPSDVDGLKKIGIDILSPNKDFTDDQYILYQLISSVPPVFWESISQESPEVVLEVFEKNTITKKYLPAIVNATSLFRDTRWAEVLSKQASTAFTHVVYLLTEDRQATIAASLFQKQPREMLEIALHLTKEWPVDLARTIIVHGLKDPWTFNRGWYNRNIDKIPVSLLSELTRLNPPGSPPGWSDMLDHISKLLSLKQSTTTIFND